MQRVYNETVGASADAAFFGSGAVFAYSRTDVKPSSERESLYKTFPKNHSRNRTVTATPQLCLSRTIVAGDAGIVSTSAISCSTERFA